MTSNPDPQFNVNNLILGMTNHRMELTSTLVWAQSRTGDPHAQQQADQHITSVLQSYKKLLQASIESQKQNYQQIEQGFLAEKVELAALSQELHGTELFLSREDRCSADEVIKAVSRLNGEIKRGSGTILDLYEGLEPSTVDAAHQRDLDYEVFWGPSHLKTKIGEDLFWMIADMGKKGNEVGVSQSEAIEWAIQAYFVWWSCWIFNHFSESGSCGRTGEPNSATLDDLYKRIQSRDPQTYSARWRVLTHKALGKDQSNYATDMIYLGILAIVYIGGLSTAAVRDQKLASAIKKFATIVVNAVREIKEQARVNIVSMDLELYSIEPGTPFNNKTATRLSQGTEDKDEEKVETRDQDTSPVLCTVGVGVRALSTVEGSSGSGRWRKLVHFPEARAEVVRHGDVILD